MMGEIIISCDADLKKAQNDTQYAKALLSHLIEIAIQHDAFSDLTERAVCDVLIDKLKSWNYVSTGKMPK